jgi:transposase InsO family protein
VLVIFVVMDINNKLDDDALLRSIYYNPASVGSFSTAWSLYTQAKPHQPTLTLQAVKTWLHNQQVHQLHKPVRKRFPRRIVRSRDLDSEWQLDLAFVRPLAHANSGTQYLLIAIDVLSRYLWVEPIKNKSGPAVAVAFEAVLNRAKPRSPASTFSDKGAEFTGQEFKAVCARHNIKQYFATQPSTKSSISERLIRTFMMALSKYISAHGKRYLPALQSLVDRYNRRCHSTLGMRPADVPKNAATIEQARRALYANDKAIEGKVLEKHYKYPVGSMVRIAFDRIKTPFYKGYAKSWSDDIYIVSKHLRSPDQPTYLLQDRVSHEQLNRFYYEPELQLANQVDVVPPAEEPPTVSATPPKKKTRSGAIYGV